MVKRILIGFAVLLLVFIALVAYQWLGPALLIAVSRQTTFLTEPLGPDGLPNFAEAIFERQREGVTPENNAAVQFWQAMGPGEMSAEDFARVANEIGLERVDLSRCLVAIHDDAVRQSLIEWIEQQRETGAESETLTADGEEANIDDDEASADQSDAYGGYGSDAYGGWGYGYGDGGKNDPVVVADRLIEFAQASPWTAADIPPLAQWVAENQQPLDSLVEAGAKPGWYSPSPSMLKRSPDSLIATLLPGLQSIRSAARALSARAMFHAGGGDYEAAWQDTRACWRLGEHAAGNWTLVGKLVGIAVRGVAKNKTLVILNQPDLPQPLAERILSDLNQLQDRIDMAEAMNFGERLAFIDSTIRICSGDFDDFGGDIGLDDEGVMAALGPNAVDGNVILEKGNYWYDKLYAAASEQDYAKRESKLTQVETELEESTSFTSNPAATVAGAIFSRQRRSEVVGGIIVRLFIPAVSAASAAADRDEALMTLTRTAAALAVYRSQHGEYPEDLGALTPELLPVVPIDLFTGDPLKYERRGEAYLLYSVGRNGTDEGGDDELGSAIVDGEWVDENADDYKPTQFLDGDYVIRLAMPAQQLPEIQLPEAQLPETQLPDSELTEESGEAGAQGE